MSVNAKSSDVKTSPRPISRTRDRQEPTSDINELRARLQADPRFNPPTPSPWKRAALLFIVVFLLWLAYKMRKPIFMEVFQQESKLVHAQRYSHEYKFRPAASPVLYETMKDGRVRVRGAMPTIR